MCFQEEVVLDDFPIKIVEIFSKDASTSSGCFTFR